MRRLLVLLMLAASVVVAGIAQTHASDLYYRTAGDPNSGNIYVVNENGGTPRVALGHAEYTVGFTAAVTRFSHAGSNGQALLQGSPTTADLQLVYRGTNGRVVVKGVTNLGGQSLALFQAPVLAQDDGYFSFRTRNGGSRSTIWRLNVTVDEALAPGYIPPTSFSDPRLQIVVDDLTNGGENHNHTWSPDGERMAYLDLWSDSGGVGRLSVRVANYGGSVDPTTHTRVLDTTASGGNWTAMLRWSPVGEEILNGSQDGGVWVCSSDAPGAMIWLARPINSSTKTQTIQERVSYPLWRPDGQSIATAYTKLTTTTKTGVTTREQQPGIMSPDGWPVLKLLRTGTTNNQHTPLGWTP